MATGPVEVLDRLYDAAAIFDDVYAAIVEEVVAAARAVAATGYVAYAVPGSPLVAERSVVLLRADPRVSVEVVVAPSFLDLAWERLAVDPVDAGVRLVDGTVFATEAAGERGPLLVAQCHSRAVLGQVKLAADDVAGEDPARRRRAPPPSGAPRRAGRARCRGPTSTAPWSPTTSPRCGCRAWLAPVAAELVALEELVRTLRARCPWDRRQTHGSLARHLLEEAYEALDAIEVVAATEPEVAPVDVAHLEEELGDLLFQVYFHALLATEEGHFTLADVARTLHDKLVSRHPHVFGDAVAETPEDVAARWEVLKKAEKGRTSVTDGIPRALPALALAAKLQRKAESLGIDTGSLDDRRQPDRGRPRRAGRPRPCPGRSRPGRPAVLGRDPGGPGRHGRRPRGDALRPGRRGPAPGCRPRDGVAGLRRRVPQAHRGLRGTIGLRPQADRGRRTAPSPVAPEIRPTTIGCAGRSPGGASACGPGSASNFYNTYNRDNTT